MSTPNELTMSHDSLDAAIAAYILAVEAGDVPNRQEWLDRHRPSRGEFYVGWLQPAPDGIPPWGRMSPTGPCLNTRK